MRRMKSRREEDNRLVGQRNKQESCEKRKEKKRFAGGLGRKKAREFLEFVDKKKKVGGAVCELNAYIEI